MGKILVVAEKPSVGRDIGKVIGATRKGDGCLIGENYVVSWAIGHLITLCDPQDYDEKLKKWRFEDLPVMPEEIKLKVAYKTKPQLKVLKDLMKDKEIDSIICATDSGREGELIFRYIYEYVGCKKAFKRLWISSMTNGAIKEGFANLKEGTEYDNLYYSAKCRSEADWLVGINASRAYTIKYDALLSIGRVQTPTLAILVARQKEIDDFIIEEYFEVLAEYEDFSGTWFFEEYSETKIQDEEKAKQIAKKVDKKTGIVEKVENEEKRQVAPLLYDLTELQRDCNKRFGFSAQKTLGIAQDLYEKRKMITYPRTDSRYLSDDMANKVKATIKKISLVEKYTESCKYIMSLSSLPLTKRIIDNSKVSDHHAIIPTDGSIKIESLTAEEFKVYNLIVLRFICVFYPPYVTNITRVIVKAEEETFISRGTVVVSEGWMTLYRDLETKKKNKEDETIIPPINEGDEVLIKSAKVQKKKTSPPKSYTEAGILSAMENAGRFIEDEELKEQLKDSGLGTPATRASIIERLISVGYVIRKGKALIPTEKGINLIEVVPEELKSPQTTGKWEKGLSAIAKGKMEDERFMDSIKRFVRYIIKEAGSKSKEVSFAEERRGKSKGALGKCPLCKNSEVFENKKAFFCGNWKKGCKFTIWKNALDTYGNSVDANKAKELLKAGKVEDISATLPQTGEKGKAALILKSDNSGALELMNFKRSEED